MDTASDWSIEIANKMARDFRVLEALRSKERAGIPLTLVERARLVVLKDRRELIKTERLMALKGA